MPYWKKIILELVPFLPLFFRMAYYPLDSGVVVKRLGCGCVQGFNANVFNFSIVLPLVLAGSFLALFYASRWLAGEQRWSYLVRGVLKQLFWAGISWMLLVWS